MVLNGNDNDDRYPRKKERKKGALREGEWGVGATGVEGEWA